jgi:asparagine N-glycosylation enzyme membrane subunit Stt3
MNLGLRRLEIVVIFAVAAVLAYAGTAWYFGITPGSGPLFLIPHPTVLNEREAILEALAESSNTTRISETERLTQLKILASSSTAKLPSTELRLQVLESLSHQ